MKQPFGSLQNAARDAFFDTIGANPLDASDIATPQMQGDASTAGGAFALVMECQKLANKVRREDTAAAKQGFVEPRPLVAPQLLTNPSFVIFPTTTTSNALPFGSPRLSAWT